MLINYIVLYNYTSIFIYLKIDIYFLHERYSSIYHHACCKIKLSHRRIISRSITFSRTGSLIRATPVWFWQFISLVPLAFRIREHIVTYSSRISLHLSAGLVVHSRVDPARLSMWRMCVAWSRADRARLYAYAIAQGHRELVPLYQEPALCANAWLMKRWIVCVSRSENVFFEVLPFVCISKLIYLIPRSCNLRWQPTLSVTRSPR